MLAPLLASLLGAIALPRAPAGADLIVHTPRLDQLEGVVAFFESAGEHAPLLRPASWRTEFHPLVEVDIGRSDSLSRAGIDPTSWATLSYVGGDRITCLTLRDPPAFESRAEERLRSLGEAWTSPVTGASIRAATHAGKVIAGYAIRGRQACAVSGSRNSESLLLQAAKLLQSPPQRQHWAALESLPGRLYLVLRHYILGLSGDSRSLSVAGKAIGIAAPRFKAGGGSPYADLPSSGVLYARAFLEPQARAESASLILPDWKALCPACEASQPRELLALLVENLTGNVLLRVDAARMSGALKTAWARYFAIKHAYLAEVRRIEEVRRALAQAAGWRGARKTPRGVLFPIEGGEVEIGVRGSQLYVGNDSGAIERAFLAHSVRPAKRKHGAELSVDPQLVSRALAQVSLLDALASRDHAPLLAISLELGPLLDATGPIKGWIDGEADGSQRFALTWTLLP